MDTRAEMRADPFAVSVGVGGGRPAIDAGATPFLLIREGSATDLKWDRGHS
jgi:hypothetical protein